MTTASRAVLAALTIVGLLSGCGADVDQVESALARFSSALAADDGAGACAVLAPTTRQELESSSGKGCAAAIDSEVAKAPTTAAVARYGDQAVARAGRDAVFLARFSEGWLVTAAGCTRTSHGLYDCTLQGG